MSHSATALEHRYSIEDALRRYCRGVDRADPDLIASAYHADAYDDHGSFKGSADTFAQNLIEKTRDRWLASQHQLHQTSIDFDGDVAWVETYFTAYHRVKSASGGQSLETFGGRYVDRFECRSEIWAIAKRTVVCDWSKIESIETEYPVAGFELGKRSGADISYERATGSHS